MAKKVKTFQVQVVYNDHFATPTAEELNTYLLPLTWPVDDLEESTDTDITAIEVKEVKEEFLLG